jgi:hypothetical protein
MTDSSSMENLEFLSDVTVTAADRLLISSLASSSLTSYMHLPEYLAEIVFPPILIDVTWLSDVGQDAPWTGRKCNSDQYGIFPEVIVPHSSRCTV